MNRLRLRNPNRRKTKMAWWIWVLIGVGVLLAIMDWLIVMGADPRKWKGGMREYEHRGIRNESDKRTKT